MIPITAKLILDYKMFFGEAPPENRLSIVKDICKEHLLYEIAGLNYHLKPKNQLYIDYSLETQNDRLKYFSQTPQYYNQYIHVAKRYTNRDNYPLFFTRQACVFALEEITNSDELGNIDGFEFTIDHWQSIIKYLLAVNYTIVQIEREIDNQGANFETLNPKLLPLNELVIETDPIVTIYRGSKLINYFITKTSLSKSVEDYFKSTYNKEPQEFIFEVLGMHIINEAGKPEFNFHYQIPKGHESLFETLSKRTINKDFPKLLGLRKSPFIKIKDQVYIISDLSFLTDKTYSQFLNDFWFDFIKTTTIDGKQYTISEYRGFFGYFFEEYLSEFIKNSFKNYKYSKLLLFGELKTSIRKGKLIEIADIYLRYTNKILLGQVKSGSIYDVAKYGGNVDSLYKNDRNKFFKDFGVDQLIESIKNMNDYISNIDDKYPKGKSLKIFPCIVVNDKAFQTPLMAETFNKRFQELVKEINIKSMHIYPLTLIHINDIEKIEEKLIKQPSFIWELLEYNFKNKKFIPPFYNTINKKYNVRDYPSRIMELHRGLIERYNPEGLDS